MIIPISHSKMLSNIKSLQSLKILIVPECHSEFLILNIFPIPLPVYLIPPYSLSILPHISIMFNYISPQTIPSIPFTLTCFLPPNDTKLNDTKSSRFSFQLHMLHLTSIFNTSIVYIHTMLLQNFLPTSR